MNIQDKEDHLFWHTFCRNDEAWYCKSPVEKNMLAQMMPKISNKAKLFQRYANHSVRATPINAMNNAGIEARHNMRASGHRFFKNSF
jgi:hypothetical protein